MSTIKILAISGSLRKSSTNTGLLRAAKQLAPKDVQIQIFDLHPMPFYNEDLNIPKKPQIILKAYEAVSKSNGLLFASPQYNYNLTPSLKNFIDWISRGDSPLKNKPLGFIQSGFSMGYVDKAIVNTVTWIKMKIYLQKNVKVIASQQNFNASGDLISEEKSYVEFVRINQ